MGHFKQLMILCVFVLLLAISFQAVFGYTVKEYNSQTVVKYYGDQYPKSYSNMGQDANQIKRSYGTNYGSTTAFIGTDGRFIRNGYGSNYGETATFKEETNQFVRKAYGSNYGETTAYHGIAGQFVRQAYGSNYGKRYSGTTWESTWESDYYDPYYDPYDYRAHRYWEYDRTYTREPYKCKKDDFYHPRVVCY